LRARFLCFGLADYSFEILPVARSSVNRLSAVLLLAKS
jgi:hypothetical protein